MSLCLEAVLCLAEHFETEISKNIYIYIYVQCCQESKAKRNFYLDIWVLNLQSWGSGQGASVTF